MPILGTKHAVSVNLNQTDKNILLGKKWKQMLWINSGPLGNVAARRKEKLFCQPNLCFYLNFLSKILRSNNNSDDASRNGGQFLLLPELKFANQVPANVIGIGSGRLET